VNFRPKFFGENVTQSSFFVGPNGYLTFEDDSEFKGNPSAHFEKQRISVSMFDLLPDAGCTISYNEPSARMDAVTVTWNNCAEFSDSSQRHSFQVSLFRNGDISMHYKLVASSLTERMVGLSRAHLQGSISPRAACARC
jgi:hypothetical protein